jgi:hypothetical protein
MSYSNRLTLLASFSSHSSVKGNCIQEWFRVYEGGSKDKLIANG